MANGLSLHHLISQLLRDGNINRNLETIMAKFIAKPTRGKRRKKHKPDQVHQASPIHHTPWVQPPRVVPPKRVIKMRADTIIARLPQMTLAETHESWLNALRILSGEEMDVEAHREAECVVRAVEETWKRRSSNQLPDGWFRWPET